MTQTLTPLNPPNPLNLLLDQLNPPNPQHPLMDPLLDLIPTRSSWSVTFSITFPKCPPTRN